MNFRHPPSASAWAPIMVVLTGLAAGSALAKLPPLSDEAKAKAAEAAARAGWTNKIADYRLCLATERVAASYLASARTAGKTLTPTPTPPCADPGPFAYTPTEARPIEAAGAHSPATTSTGPPSTMAPAATTTPTPAKR